VLRSDHCAHECFLFSSIRDREARRDLEVRIVRRDGTEIPVSVSTAALQNADGHVIGGVEMFRDVSEVDKLRREVEASYTTADIITKSPAMRGVRDILPLVARSTSTVLIEGEPGSGKELVARAIHNLGPRSDGPFVAVNCGAIPDTLVESELFGHVRGAFTDARRDRPGRFALAEGGTLLLDEVGELSPANQVKLLRVLQEREYTPLGAVEAIKADIRIIAATNRDLSVEVLHGRFRQDLFFRLHVVRVTLPPLRSRTEDIPLLVDHFIARFNALQGRRVRGISERAMALLMRYSFPGNVRELENAVEHAFVVGGAKYIEAGDLPPHIQGHSPVGLGPPAGTTALPRTASSELGPLEDAEAATLRACLERHRGNRTRAARDLGISRNTLWRKLKRYGIGGGQV
jgi:transcriptional regulator with PAS, ATPase and Fis domain